MDEENSENPQSNVISTLQLASPLETIEDSEVDQQIDTSDIQLGSISDPSLLLYNSLRKNISETELKCQVFYKFACLSPYNPTAAMAAGLILIIF